MRVARRLAVAAVLALLLATTLWMKPALTTRTDLAPAGPDAAKAGRVVNRVGSGSSPTRHRPRPVQLSAATTVLNYPPPPIRARAAILVDMKTGRILFQKNADQRLPMASTTKITTAALALHLSHLSDLVTISQNAATVGESTMGLLRGERVTVLQLLYGLLLNSGNDAAVALAEHAAGSEARFVGMMNRLAARLVMRNTHYQTPHGLDTPNHYSSARDLATIALYAMRNRIFRQIVATPNIHFPPTHHSRDHWLANINRVMFWYPGVTGVKPGDTDAAGFCQVVSVDRDGRRLLAVLLNSPTLVFDIRNLLNYGLRDFRWVQAPAYWDTPANSVSGRTNAGPWIYYYGGGHYIRGPFLSYFRTHGGLTTFGYPRTEQIVENGSRVQYFQGSELAYDTAHGNVYPVDLGTSLSPARGVGWLSPWVAGLYHQVGGAGVLGRPVGGMVRLAGRPAQFFQYGALEIVGGAARVMPLGDLALAKKGWLSGFGLADSYPWPLSTERFPSPAPLRTAVHKQNRRAARNEHRTRHRHHK